MEKGRRRIIPTAPGARGITLLEVCFALALLCVLAGVAAPAFRASLRTAAVRSATFEVIAALRQVRAESILEARPGALCPVSGTGGCLRPAQDGVAWQWFLEDGDLVLRDLPRGVVLRATRSPLRFWPHARAASTGTLTICDAQGLAAPRAIVVSQTGRARVAAARAADCT